MTLVYTSKEMFIFHLYDNKILKRVHQNSPNRLMKRHVFKTFVYLMCIFNLNNYEKFKR